MQKIGIYSGTFDPLHEGHLAFALAALEQRELEKVIFIPESSPREKQNVSPFFMRLKQLTEYLHAYPRLDVHSLKSTRFTVHDTLPELQQQFPQATFTFLVGSDVALGLRDWPDIQLLLKTSTFAIGMRADQTDKEIERSLEQLNKIYDITIEATIIHTDKANLASSNLR